MRLFDPGDEYAPVAPFYDALIGPLLLPIRREVCRLAKARGCRMVLDVCCGTGEQAVMLSQAGLRVAGVDMSPSMIRVARRNSPSTVTYYREDASRLHFPDRSFDGAVISMALHEMDEDSRERVLRETGRVLTESASLIIVDYLAGPAHPGGWSQSLVAGIEWLAGERHFANYKSFRRAGGLEGILTKHGLTPVGVKGYALGVIGIALAR